MWQQRLLGNAQAKASGFACLAQKRQNGIHRIRGHIFQIVRLNAGDAAAEQIGLCIYQQIQQLLCARGGEKGLDIIQDFFFYYAVGYAACIRFHTCAEPACGISRNAVKLHCFLIQHTDMKAGAHDEKRILRGDFIEIIGGGKSLFIGEIILIPTFTDQPETGIRAVALFKAVAHAEDNLGKRSAAREINGGLGFCIMQIMHMAVVKAGHQKLAAAVQNENARAGMLLQIGFRILQTADKCKETADNDCGLSQWVGGIHGCNFGVLNPD